MLTFYVEKDIEVTKVITYMEEESMQVEQTKEKIESGQFIERVSEFIPVDDDSVTLKLEDGSVLLNIPTNSIRADRYDIMQTPGCSSCGQKNESRR